METMCPDDNTDCTLPGLHLGLADGDSLLCQEFYFVATFGHNWTLIQKIR